MDFTGLIVRFPANRLLTQQERAHQLHQQRRLNMRPTYQLAVIKMNTTYLESVDKWFGWKGSISLFAVAIFLIFTLTLGVAAAEMLLGAAGVIAPYASTGYLLRNGVPLAAVVSLIVWFTVWLLRKEAFAYTHYPIRFNRKTRMVHVWRTDGSVLTVPWDEVFFTLFSLSGEWEVRGHVLAADRATIIESFALSYSSVLLQRDINPPTGQFSDQDFVRSHWEFIRRYMEEGPESVGGQVQFCMPVDGRRETAKGGMHRVFANFSGGSWVTIIMVAPICLTVALFRFFAMRTSRIPQWPEEIEAACVINDGDPYAIVGDRKGNSVAVYSDAARAAGISSAAASVSHAGAKDR